MSESEGEGFLSRIIPGTRLLQTLASTGDVREDHIQEAEESLIENQGLYEEKFESLFLEHMGELEDLIKDTDQKSGQKIALIASSVANFRANSSMIGVQKYLNICSVFLNWAESIKKIDVDAQDVVEGYMLGIKTIEREDSLSEEQIKSVTLEVDLACRRFFQKHHEICPTTNIDNSQNLYISERNQDCGIKE